MLQHPLGLLAHVWSGGSQEENLNASSSGNPLHLQIPTMRGIVTRLGGEHAILG